MRQPMRHLLAIFCAAGILLAAGIAMPQRASAGTLSTSITGMFPKQVGEFAYADLKSARKYPWFQQLREQLLPSRFRQFEQFLASAGVDPNSQVDELAWGAIASPKGGGEQIVGVALGSFNPSSSEDRFKQRKLPMFDVHGYHLYAFGSGTGPNDILFMFIDSNTAAFGHRSALEQLIDVRTGVSESLLTNDRLFPLINEANGTGIIWAVLNQKYTHLAVQQLLPQANQFPQAAEIIGRLQAMTINIEADSGVDAHFQAVCSSTDDANLLAAALQAGLLYRRYQEAQTHPDLASALDQVRVQPSGDRLKIEAPVSQDQLLSLIHTRAFAVPM
ncbi:MAG TPA: hypothetical protein VNM68_14090 [Candidatus Polarisedimenticolia bacterium]|nr:hypothetical protein [Candidatus Polarisedimenticolia bacterium]